MSIESAVERIHRLVTTRADAFKNEDAIKASLVMPFLAGLGNDPFDPDHVVAGFRTDAGKVDFATVDDAGVPHILICVTSTPEDLVTPRAKGLSAMLAEIGDIGLLTNGHVYRFHGLGSNRAMLSEPFMAFDLSDGIIEASILEPLTREGYDLEAAVAAGRMTKLPVFAFDTLLEQLSENSAIHEVIAGAIVPTHVPTDASRAAVTEAFARALRILRGDEPAIQPEAPMAAEDEDDNVRVISGDEEAAYQAVRRIAARYIDGARVHARPAQAYLAVLLDDNNRRSICRLYFSASSTRYIGTFSGRDEDKQRITGFADVEKFERQIESRLRELDPGAFAVRAAEREREEAEQPRAPIDETSLESQAGASDGAAAGSESSEVDLHADSNAGDRDADVRSDDAQGGEGEGPVQPDATASGGTGDDDQPQPIDWAAREAAAAEDDDADDEGRRDGGER